MNLRSKQDFLAYKYRILPTVKGRKIAKQFTGSSRSIFVGEYGYPNVGVGILTAEQYEHNDDHTHWLQQGWSISQIAKARFDLINSNKKQNVKTPDVGTSQEIALSSKPTSVDVEMKKEPRSSFTTSDFHKPMGPSGELQNVLLTSNPRIPSKISRIVEDRDLKAAKGVSTLFDKGVDTEYLTQIFSSGSLGVQKNRVLVPTKWSITAVDDIAGKALLEEVRDFQTTGNFVYQGQYMGNYFFVAIFDGPVAYELFEFFRDNPSPTTDFENWKGRKSYATETAGGYYAVRLAVLEKCREIKRQGQALVVRFITDDYYMPLGVWVPREAARNAMKSKPLEFGSEELMLKYIFSAAKKKFGQDISWLKRDSKLLEGRKQRSLEDYA